MKTLSQRREAFRAILNGPDCVVPGSVFDPISARLAQEIGFRAGMFAGSVGSLAVLGAPDIIVLTLSEFAAQARRITRASDLPLLVDADHGYGNALNVMRTVEELEAAGVAAMTIEDTELPRSFGLGDKPRLLSLEEGVGKMRAAVAARIDPSLVIAARTSAAQITGIEDAVRRVHAYGETGVDAVFLTGIKSPGDLTAISEAVKLPILLGVIGKGVDDPALLARSRVRIGLRGHLPIMASIQATYEALKAMHSGEGLDKVNPVEPAVLKSGTREVDYALWTREFLEP